MVLHLSLLRIPIVWFYNRCSSNNIPRYFTNGIKPSAGSTLLHIASHLSYKPHPDLNIHKANQIESTFVEIINPKKSNIVIGGLHKQPNIDVIGFKKNYLSQIFEIVSKE